MKRAAVVITANGQDWLNEYIGPVSSQGEELLLAGLKSVCTSDYVLYIPDYHLSTESSPQKVGDFIRRKSPDVLYFLVTGPIVVSHDADEQKPENWLLLGRCMIPISSLLKPVHDYLLQTDQQKNKPFALCLFDEACTDTKIQHATRVPLTVSSRNMLSEDELKKTKLPLFLRIRASLEFVTSLNRVMHLNIPPQPIPRAVICSSEFTDNHHALRTGDPNHPSAAFYGHPSDDRAKCTIFMVRGLQGEASPFNKEHSPNGGRVSLYGLFQYVRTKLREGDEGTGNRVMMADSSPMSPDNKIWNLAIS